MAKRVLEAVSSGQSVRAAALALAGSVLDAAESDAELEPPTLRLVEDA